MSYIPSPPPKLPLRYYQRIGRWGTDLGKNGLFAFLVAIAVTLGIFVALAILWG